MLTKNEARLYVLSRVANMLDGNRSELIESEFLSDSDHLKVDKALDTFLESLYVSEDDLKAIEEKMAQD